MAVEGNKVMYRHFTEEAFNKGNMVVVDEIIASNFISNILIALNLEYLAIQQLLYS